MGVDVIERGSFPISQSYWETGHSERHWKPITIGDTVAALWRGLTARQPGGFIMDKLRRAQTMITALGKFWASHSEYLQKSRNFYGKDLQYPTMFEDQDPVWRNPRAGQYHIAYQDPSPNPRWRLKQIIEFVDDRDVGRKFMVSGSNVE
ncbi:hypothetical protein Daus18300_013487, partial [Diaporthe australafricana]